MAGLQSQNISVASTRAPRSAFGADGSTHVTRSTCVFCGRKSYPPESDPHAPVFALFSLVDCPHYACQPCALVHCDNAGRSIECPTCHCISRLAQTGKKRSASKRAKDEAAEAEARRVALDDGVSSVASRGSRASARGSAAAAAAVPTRSALKTGKDGSGAKKRASSVQFPATVTGRSGSDAEDGSGGNSPLTADAVSALPVDPQHAAKTRGRRAEATSDAGSSDHAVGLYSLSTKKKPTRSSSSSRRKPPLAPPAGASSSLTAATKTPSGESAKGRPQSQPAPQLENRLLPPPEPFVAPPPLRLHTIEEDEAAAAAAVEAAAKLAAAADAAEKPADAAPTTTPPVPAADVAEAAAQLARVQQEEAQACIDGEQDERDIINGAWSHTFKKLQAAKDDDWAAINTRRELEDEFALSPGGTPSPFSHANNTSLQTAPSTTETPVVAKPDAEARPITATATTTSAQLPTTGPAEAESTTSTHAKTPDESQVSITSDDASQPSSASKDSGTRPPHARRKKSKSAVKADAAAGPMDEGTPPSTASAGTSPIPQSVSETDVALASETVAREKDGGMDSVATTAPGSVVSDITSVAPSEVVVRHANARLQLEQLEAVERYALEDVENAIRQHVVQIVDHLDDALAQSRDTHAQELARVEQIQAQARQDDVVRDEDMERVEIEVAQTRSWGALGADEAHARVEAARAAAQREEDDLNALRAARREQDAWDSIQAHQAQHEPSDRHRIEGEERDARQQLDRDADDAAMVLASRQRAAATQQCLADLDELLRDEDDDRFDVREAERVERRELRAQLLHTLATQRRADAYAQETSVPLPPAPTQSAAPQLTVGIVEPDQASVGPTTTATATTTLANSATTASIAPQPTDTSLTDPFTGSGVGSGAAAAAAQGSDVDRSQLYVNRTQPASPSQPQHQQQQQQQRQAPTPLTPSQNASVSYHTPSELLARQLQETERYYQDEIGEAYNRLREAQRRLQEEALAREQAEREREAAQRAADRIVEEAERNAADRIRRARLATEEELDERLAAVRSESERRAAHDATLRALDEEEQRAILEVKLLAAQRALEEAQHRALDDLNRAREEAAVQAAAEAARIERQAREREAELEAKRHAAHMLQLAEQEQERAAAAEQLRLVEARAAEAIQRAREEAQLAAEEAQARFEALQLRQAARAVEVQSAQASVHQALEDIRAHDSSHRTSPVNISVFSSSSQQSRKGPAPGSAQVDTSFTVPSQDSRRGETMTPYVTVQPRPPEVSPPPRFSPPRPAIMMQQQQQPVPAMTTGYDYVAVPSGVASAHGGSSRTSPVRESTLPRSSTPLGAAPAATTPMTPRTMISTIVQPMFAHFQELTDHLIQNTIREAAREIGAARATSQKLRDQADTRLEESERRYRRRRADRDRVEQDLSEMTHHSSIGGGSSRSATYGTGASAGRAGATSASDAGPLDRSDDASSGRYYRDHVAAPLPSQHGGASASSAAARALFFDQPSPLNSRGREPWQQQQQQQQQEQGLSSRLGRPPYYQPPPFPYTAVRHPEALLAGHRYFFQRPAPFTALPDDAVYETSQQQEPPSEAYRRAAPPQAGNAEGEAMMMNSPPPRRSQTRAEPDSVPVQQQQQQEPKQQQQRAPRQQPLRMDFSPGPTSSTAPSTSMASSSVVPQASPMCQQCYREDTTSPCWQCGAMVCRRCGPPLGQRRLCCAAHFRTIKRAHRAAKLREAEEAYRLMTQHDGAKKAAPANLPGATASAAASAPAGGARPAEEPKRSMATSPIPIQVGSEDASSGDDHDSSHGDVDDVAMLPDTHSSAAASSLSEVPAASALPQRERRPSQILPSQYRIQTHPYSPTRGGATEAQSVPPSREAVATQTSELGEADVPSTNAVDDAAGLSPLPVAPPASTANAATTPEALSTPIHQTAHRNEDDSHDDAAANEEPKTERKSHGFFFVPFGDGEDGPRRAKPPTPRNYQPRPQSAHQRHQRDRYVPSPRAQQRAGPGGRRPSPAAAAAAPAPHRRPQSRGGGGFGAQPSAKRGGPSHSRGAEARTQQPSLHVYKPGQRLWPDDSARDAHRPRSRHARRHDDDGPTKPDIDVADLYARDDQDDLYPAQRPVRDGYGESGRHRPLSASQPVQPAQPPSFTYPPQQQRPQQQQRGAATPSTTTASSATQPVDGSDSYPRPYDPVSPPSAEVVRAAAELLASRQHVPRGMVDTPESTPVPRAPARAPVQEPRTCGKATLPSVGTDAYNSHSSRDPREYGAHPAGRGAYPRPAPRSSAGLASGKPFAGGDYVDMRPATANDAAQPRGAPTLEELDRRLRQLRAEDRQSTERYYAQQQQSRPRALYNPDIYVNMMMPRGGGSGAVPEDRPTRTNSSRRRQPSAVSPPWRTDDNSPAVRPAWNVQQPHSPLYRPPVA